jgi:pimeloyl-ACP methyl ester carboxylesterase
MGSVVGQILCERYPEQVAAFFNVEGNISGDDCTISRRVTKYSRDDFLDHGMEKMLDAFYRHGRSDPVYRNYFASVRICDPRTYYENSHDLVRLSDEEKLAERFASLAIPKVYVLGDPGGTGELSRDLLTRAGVEWRAIDDAGHWPFADQPEAFVDELLRFLDSVRNAH